MNICKRFIVIGRVQGVWFRRETKHEAQKLELEGYTRNLASGEVEVVACGEIKSLEQLEAWLWKGPLLARVDGLTSEEIEPRIFCDFEIL